MLACGSSGSGHPEDAGGGAGGAGGGTGGSVGDAGLDATGSGGRDGGAPDGPTICSPSGPDGGTDGTWVTLGDPCTSSGALGCAGKAQKASLICSSGTWHMLTTCGATQNCDGTTGVCTDIVPGCVGHAAGYKFCNSDVLETCGPDLVDTSAVTCCGPCSNGSCQAASCGDGKVETGEECDDGNATPADGCENDCKQSKVMRLTGGGAHTCALLREGFVRCWGANDQGQLGLGTNADMTANHPYQNGVVKLGAAATAVVAGRAHTCALMTDGTVRCWGANNAGQLGLGNTMNVGDNEAPDAQHATAMLGMPAIYIGAGGDVTCAVMMDGTLRCWGQNNYGQLGLGHTRVIGDDELPTAANAQVILDDTVSLVGPGGDHTCAVMSSNLVRCWGRNDLGQLGLGYTMNIGDNEPPTAAAAIMFPGATTFGAILAGATRTFAWMADGNAMRGWGDNSDYGLGVDFAQAMPDAKATDWGDFSFVAPIQEIAVGGYHVCIRLQNHQMRCWGINDQAQLGLPNRMTLGDNEPIVNVNSIDLGTDATGAALYANAMGTGLAHTCALLNTGIVRCWGTNGSGQLGLGYTSPAPTTYVGGTADTVPGKLDAVQVFPPAQ
jgi:cysteine-rich repeat protein